MRPEDIFFDGVTQIREELIEEAQRYVFRRRVSWRRYAALAAACLALALGINWMANFGIGGSSADSGGTASGNGAQMDHEPEAPETDRPWGEYSFTADVVEVYGDGSLLVVPLPGSGVWTVADRVTVPVDGVANMPRVRPGDTIEVVYSGTAEKDYVNGVTEIRILD